MAHAYCFASGQIEIGNRIPAGALPIAKGPTQALRDLMNGVSRHSRADNTIYVPGIPEAETQDAALDALASFTNWISKKLPAGVETIHSAHKPAARKSRA